MSSNRVDQSTERFLLKEAKKASDAYKYEDYKFDIPEDVKKEGYSQYKDFPVYYNDESGFQGILLFNEKEQKVEFRIAGTNEFYLSAILSDPTTKEFGKFLLDAKDNWFTLGGGKQAEYANSIFGPIYKDATLSGYKIYLYGDSGAGYIIENLDRTYININTFSTNNGSDSGGFYGKLLSFFYPNKYAYSSAYVEASDYGLFEKTTKIQLDNAGEPVYLFTPNNNPLKKTYFKVSSDAKSTFQLMERGLPPTIASLLGGGFGLHTNREGDKNSLLSSGVILSDFPKLDDIPENSAGNLSGIIKKLINHVTVTFETDSGVQYETVNISEPQDNVVEPEASTISDTVQQLGDNSMLRTDNTGKAMILDSGAGEWTPRPEVPITVINGNSYVDNGEKLVPYIEPPPIIEVVQAKFNNGGYVYFNANDRNNVIGFELQDNYAIIGPTEEYNWPSYQSWLDREDDVE